MQTSDKLDKLMPALMAARKLIKPAAKSGKNKFDHYHYATLEDWHNAVMPPLLANGFVLAMSTDGVEHLAERPTKSGGREYPVSVVGAARLLHESGQWLEIRGVGVGQERGDKGVYQAITGMNKYLYAQMFALPTTDDPERSDRGTGEPAPSPAAYSAPAFKTIPAKPFVNLRATAEAAIASAKMATNLAGIVQVIEKDFADTADLAPLIEASRVRMVELVVAAINGITDRATLAKLNLFVAEWPHWNSYDSETLPKLIAERNAAID